MRKVQQKQILEVLDTLREAQSAGLYADCQDGAIGVGEYIEQIAGEGTRTVALLEEYCDLLYKASIGEVSEKALKEHIASIEKSVRSELKPNRVEIVFLSYKASMSDSIESIYLAAKADPNCDAFWIPIPYFDRNADGSAGLTHFEGADYYSDDIECTHFREYDIEARRPDAVFTFNPYDEANYVTSVHPDFYCERLRGLTDMLVYVPYFVAAAAVAEPYVTLPGCLYAHKVVVQSEAIRDTYIRYYRQNYGNEFGRPEDKFIALGSPKFDKVLNAKRENCMLPDEWREFIGNKKVVLYNTSINAILAGGEQYLIKLRHVLEVFRKREDVVLWWRPHPLSEATFESMRSDLYTEYREIATDYRREGLGIYDDTPDLHRAIVWSDAYYGDHSSVAVLYAITGKPIMMQNCKSVGGEDFFALSALKSDGNSLWGLVLGFSGIVKMHFEGEAVKLDAWRNEYEFDNGFGAFKDFTIIDDKIYVAPGIADDMYVFDISSGTFSPLNFSAYFADYTNKLSDTDKLPKFGKILKTDNSLFFVGQCIPIILEYSLDDKSVVIHDEWLNDKALYSDGETNTFDAYGYDNGVISASFLFKDLVLQYNTSSATYAIKKIDNYTTETLGILGMEFLDNGLILTFRGESNPVIWNPENEECKTIEILTQRKEFSRSIIRYKNYIYFLPYRTHDIIKYDTETKAGASVYSFDKTINTDGMILFPSTIHKDELYMSMVNSPGGLWKLNFDKDEISKIECIYSDNTNQQFNNVNSGDLLCKLCDEAGLMNLSKYFSVLSERKKSEQIETAYIENKSVGYEIYKHVKMCLSKEDNKA